MPAAPSLQVVSGDTVVVQGLSKAGSIPPEKRITLSSLIAPKLVSTAGSECLVFRAQIQSVLQLHAVACTAMLVLDL